MADVDYNGGLRIVLRVIRNKGTEDGVIIEWETPEITYVYVLGLLVFLSVWHFNKFVAKERPNPSIEPTKRPSDEPKNLSPQQKLQTVTDDVSDDSPQQASISPSNATLNEDVSPGSSPNTVDSLSHSSSVMEQDTPEENPGQSDMPVETNDAPRSRDLPLLRSFNSRAESKDEDLEPKSLQDSMEPTPEEQNRFRKLHNGNTTLVRRSLYRYLEWRRQHAELSRELKLEASSNDCDHWAAAAATAIKSCGETCSERLPRIGRLLKVDGRTARDLDGFRFIYILPGQIDKSLAAHSTYALAMALYVERKLRSDSLEKLTLVIDVRRGVGWPWNNGIILLPFVRSVTGLVSGLFPDRLHTCILYPMPPAAMWIWGIVSRFIDPVTRSRIVLLSGEATIQSPPPVEQMKQYFDARVIETLEKERLADFKPA